MKSKTKKPRLSNYEHKMLKAVVVSLKRKVIGSPTGMEPPSLAALIDRVRWAFTHPGCFNEIYVRELWKDIAEVEEIVRVLNDALLASSKYESTILMKLASRKTYGRKVA